MNLENLNRLADKMDFILGSSSPRRRALLEEASIRFRCLTPTTDETRLGTESPIIYANRLAGQKSLDVAGTVSPEAIVLGCDTVVMMGDLILQKPRDEQEAMRTLKMLIGKQHVVCTALALACPSLVLASGYETTIVHFNDATDSQLRQYIESGEPMDKAGAYGIQGMGAFLVDRIEGSLDNVIGLPCVLLDRLAGEVLLKTRPSID